jgi:hypothetical protein
VHDMQAGFPGRCYVVDLPASLLHTVRTGWFERGAIAHRCAVNIGETDALRSGRPRRLRRPDG